MDRGKVWLVGAGPSDPGLLTIKGKEIIENADVIVYDKLVGQGILDMIPYRCERINVGKSSGHHPIPQEEINQLLLDEAKKGRKVVRLKGGDPFLFGRGGEELELLEQHGIPYEIVPGIPSPLAVPAYAGIPVTHRDFVSSLHIITAHGKRGTQVAIDYETLVKLDGTLVFLMGVSSLPSICKGLESAGMTPDMPAAIIENGTSAEQRQIIADIRTLPQKAEEAGIKAPAVIIIGQVCELSKRFHWKDIRPLDGIKVILTRPLSKTSNLQASLYSLGAQVISLPLIESIPLINNKQLENAVHRICDYRWIVFTSEWSVQHFFNLLHNKRIDIRNLQGIKFAAVGSMTQQAIENKGIFVDYVPEKYYGEELGKGLLKLINNGEEVLLLTPKNTVSDCAEQLRIGNITFDEIPIYETIFDESNTAKLKSIEFDHKVYAAFTSVSTVKGFVKALGDFDFTKVKAVCIGEKTAAEARNHKMQVYVSEMVSIESMTEQFIQLNSNQTK